MRRKSLHKTRFRYASKPVILTAICCGDRTCTSNSQLPLYMHVRGVRLKLVYNISQFDGIDHEANALFNDGVACSVSYCRYSALSRKWQFLLLKLTYCCKGSRTGFVLISRGQTLFRTEGKGLQCTFTMGLFYVLSISCLLYAHIP